jgi:putative flippase GtrA
MTQTDVNENSVVSDHYEPSAVEPELKVVNTPLVTVVHTYHPTHWSFVNNLLDIADSITHGRAGQLQRFISFAFFGGLAALVNLVVFYVVYYHSGRLIKISDANLLYVIAYVIAAEVSIVANFSLNDYFTFRYMPGHARSWRVRCARFHITSISGIILTFLIGFGLKAGLHVTPVLSQAIAIMIVLFYNFAAHHFFTYRHVETVVAK